MGFLVLGYYLSNLTIRKKYIPITFIVIGALITMYGTYYLTQKNDEFSVYFYKYLTPNVILSSIGVFLLFKDLNITNKRIRKMISFLSNLSFGVYLVHILILALLTKVEIDWTFTQFY